MRIRTIVPTDVITAKWKGMHSTLCFAVYI